MNRFLSGVLVALISLVSFLVPAGSATAADSISTFTLKTNYPLSSDDLTSTIEVQHDSSYTCLSSNYSGGVSCSISVQARFTNANPSDGVTLELQDSGGASLNSNYLSSYDKGWKTLNYTVSTASSMNVKFGIASSSLFNVTGSSPQNIYLFAGPTPTPATFEPIWDSNVEASGMTYSTMVDERFRFLEVYYPTQMNLKTKCFDYQVFVRPINLVTGGEAGSSFTSKAQFTFTITDPNDYFESNLGEMTLLPEAVSWSATGPTEIRVPTCGGSDKKDSVREFSLNVDYEVTGLASDTYDVSFSTVGTLKYKILNCLKGKSVKVISAAAPSCPSGYSPTKLKVVGGKLAPTSIRCQKGLNVKKISGVLPSCPAGWRKL